MKIQLALLAVALAGSASVARAQIIGQLYEHTGTSPWPASTLGGTGSDANAAVPGGVTPDVTFSVHNGSLSFQAGQNSVAYTIGGFLTSGGATVLTGAGQEANSMADTMVFMSGSVTMVNGQTYHTEHDDGLEITINGVNVVNAPGPTSASSTPFTWTGASGNYAFNLEYSEVNGAPAVLQTDLPLTASTTVPDSATTMGLLGISLSALGAFHRRIKK